MLITETKQDYRDNPVFERARLFVMQKNLSKAVTPRGITNCLRANPKTRRQHNNERTGIVSKKDYLEAESLRKSNPEAKRAKKDRKFRKAYFKRLNREIDKLINVPMNTLKEITEASTSFTSRKAQLARRYGLIEFVTGKPHRQNKKELKPLSGFKVGFTTEFARKHGCDFISMRGLASTIAATKGKSRLVHEDPETEWRNGRVVSYTRARNDNYVRSFGIITSPQVLQYAFHETEVELTLPEGYEWKQDHNGLFACRGQDHYHPDVTQLLMKDASAHIVYHIGLNAERREIYRLQEKAEAADMEGVFVCLADARRAGNCEAGCRSFIERNHLSSCKHYKATELLEIAGGDRNAVRLAITAASIRTKRENEIGMAVLTDHFPDLKYA